MMHKTTRFWSINFAVKRCNENLDKIHIQCAELPEHFLKDSRINFKHKRVSHNLLQALQVLFFQIFNLPFDRYKILITELSHHRTSDWEWIYTPFQQKYKKKTKGDFVCFIYLYLDKISINT